MTEKYAVECVGVWREVWKRESEYGVFQRQKGIKVIALKTILV